MPTKDDLAAGSPFNRPGRDGKVRFDGSAERNPTKDNEEKKKNAKTVVNNFALPRAATARATLVELENPEEFLEFHWDPTTYKISKEAKWGVGPPIGGTDILNYGGCTLTKVTFQMFLNDIGLHRDIQRSSEDSLAWLFQRLRPREKRLLDLKGLNRNPSAEWLNVSNAKADKPPPTLVLFGMKQPFKCVLKGCDAATEFQNARQVPGVLNAKQQQRATRNFDPAGAFGRALVRSAAKGYGGEITRARVNITLWEYVKDPS